MLQQPSFLDASVDTYFIDEHPQLFQFKPSRNRAQKLLNYLGEVQVNGPTTPLVTSVPPAAVTPPVPHVKAGKSLFILTLPEGLQDHVPQLGSVKSL